MARAFRFRLEAVGRVRRQARDERQRAVGEAARSVGEVETRIEQLTQALRDTLDQSRETQQAGRLDLVALRNHQFYQGRLHQRLLQCHEELGHRREDLHEKRTSLGEAMKRLKVIEKLHEKHQARHVKRLRREEQSMADEAALQAFRRGRDRSSRACEVSS